MMKPTLLLSALFIPFMAQAAITENTLPPAYQESVQRVEQLVAPLVELTDSSLSYWPITGPASDHGAEADRFEAFARPGLLIALWLQTESLPAAQRTHTFTKETVAASFRKALLMGTDSKNPQFWGHQTNYYQHGVEMAILTMALEVAHSWVWDPLSTTEKEQVASWLGEIRGNARYWNNHLYFAVLTLEFLRDKGFEKDGDQAAIDYMFQLLEIMHIEKGWFKDGMNETFDYYNAYAFHAYGLWWAWKYGHTNPERAERWKAWSQEFLADYIHFFAASGENIPFGRSITYRFNSLAVFGLAHQNSLDAVSPGLSRHLCQNSLKFFLSHPILQEQGLLSVGWSNHFQGIAEPYTCAASPYWAAKGLLFLTLPSTHPFWNDPEELAPIEKAPFVRAIPGPRFVIRSVEDEVELLNAGSQVGLSNAKRYGPWKWTKIAFRSGLGFLTADSVYDYPFDSALTVERENNPKRFGRQPTIPIYCSEDHLAYLYGMGTREDVFNVPVRTDVFWKDEWILAIHQVESFEPVRYFHGSYALGSAEPQFETLDQDSNYTCVRNQTHWSALQPISGVTLPFLDQRLDDSKPRQHLNAPYHCVPVYKSTIVTGKQTIAVLYGAGTILEQSKPWSILKTDQGHWKLAHPVLGEWTLNDPALPALKR
jgi:hypothetical protein